jgi:hypothetical protein
MATYRVGRQRTQSAAPVASGFLLSGWHYGGAMVLKHDPFRTDVPSDFQRLLVRSAEKDPPGYGNTGKSGSPKVKLSVKEFALHGGDAGVEGDVQEHSV